MNNLNAYIDLTRIKRPIGIWLLWIPCLWGLSFSKFSIYEALLYLIASISMRSVGCIINDCFDKDIDAKVERTKNRPIACGLISVKQALVFAFICTLPAVLFFFLHLTYHQKIFSIIGFLAACIYPLFKRFTHFPQLFLGLTYNVGIWISSYDLNPLYVTVSLYCAAIFWTLAYDTVYAFQDIKDDLLVGVKSTAIRFQKNPKLSISAFYFMFLLFLFLTKILVAGISITFVVLFFILCGAIALHIYYWNPDSTKSCLRFFLNNTYIGIYSMVLGLI